MSNRKLLFVVNSLDFFISHRIEIALESQRRGFDVHVAAGDRVQTPDFSQLGFTYHYLPISRSGKNVFLEFQSFTFMCKLFLEIEPDLVHLVTIKPVLYGGLAARITRVRGVVSAVSGLGSVFLARGARAFFLRKVVSWLYRHSLSHPNICVIFQNSDDRDLFIDSELVVSQNTTIIYGSGVDLNKFLPKPEKSGVPRVVFASRLIEDKGIVEFVCAARKLIADSVDVEFVLIGGVDPGNPTSVTLEMLDSWQAAGYLKWKGFSDSMDVELEESHMVVLPSYREGLPKILIEAAASARAIVTTDVPGCRDAVVEGRTGLVVPVKDVESLTEAIRFLLENSGIRKQMGVEGRAFAERKFNVRDVVHRHIEIYEELLQGM